MGAANPAAGGANPTSTAEAQRDRLLSRAGIVLGSAFVLTAAAGLVDAIDVVHTYDSAGLGVGHGFLFLGALATVAAGYLLGSAFSGRPHDRAALLRKSGLAYAAGSAAVLVGASVMAVDYVAHHFPGTFSASWLVTALAAAIAAASGLLFASAWTTQPDGRVTIRPNQIAASGGVAALGALFAGVSTTLLLVAYAEHYLPSGLAGGLGVETAGHFLLAGALVTASAAFLRWRIRPDADDILDRDAVLALGAIISAAAYLLICAGGAMRAEDANVLSTGAGSVSTLLMAVQALAWSAALAWAALGLYRSSRR